LRAVQVYFAAASGGLEAYGWEAARIAKNLRDIGNSELASKLRGGSVSRRHGMAILAPSGGFARKSIPRCHGVACA
jgi:hypothetical protein